MMRMGTLEGCPIRKISKTYYRTKEKSMIGINNTQINAHVKTVYHILSREFRWV